eukprot:1934236-Amphidinium_carterae.1
MELGIIKSREGLKLHLHTNSASSKAMVSKLGMSKNLNEVKGQESVLYIKMGTQNNPSDIRTKRIHTALRSSRNILFQLGKSDKSIQSDLKEDQSHTAPCIQILGPSFRPKFRDGRSTVIQAN